MTMQGKVRPWITPTLIVLARSHPEECVLANCKTEVVTGGSQFGVHGCGTTGATPCGPCQSRGVSGT